MIASAACTVAPPANTAKRAKHACSSSLSSSWLQSIVARSVCWRAGASRGAGAQRAERGVQALRDLRRVTAARSGRPPARSPAAARRHAGRSPRPRRVVVAQLELRVVRSRALAEQRDGVHVGQRLRVRSALGQRERRHGVALLGLQGERLAARGQHRDAGTRDRSSPPMNGAAPSRCSQLSTTSSRCLAARKRSTACSADSPESGVIAERADDRRGNVLRSLARRRATRSARRPRSRARRRARPRARAASCRHRRGRSASTAEPCPPQPLAERAELMLAADRAIRRRRQRALAARWRRHRVDVRRGRSRRGPGRGSPGAARAARRPARSPSCSTSTSRASR